MVFHSLVRVAARRTGFTVVLVCVRVCMCVAEKFEKLREESEQAIASARDKDRAIEGANYPMPQWF